MESGACLLPRLPSQQTLSPALDPQRGHSRDRPLEISRTQQHVCDVTAPVALQRILPEQQLLEDPQQSETVLAYLPNDASEEAFYSGNA